MEKGVLTKKEMEKLGKKLSYEPKLVWDEISQAEKQRILKFGNEYKRFLDLSKTEREAVVTIREMAKILGFREAGRSKVETHDPFIP